MNKKLVTRYEGNPILTKDDIPYSVETVHNAIVGRIDEINRADCRKHVEENFSIDCMIDAYEKVYREIFEKEAR